MAWESCLKDRTPEQLQSFLRFYDAHRENYPLPEQWSEDLTGVRLRSEGQIEGYPEMIFRKETWKGAITVEVELVDPVRAFVFITDETGEGFTETELQDTLRLLVGVDLPPEEGEDETDSQWKPPQEFTVQVHGGPWEYDFSFDFDPDSSPSDRASEQK